MSLSIAEIGAAFWADEILEYHVMGNEIGRELIPGPNGWYPCEVISLMENDEVEVELIDYPINITVPDMSIPIAFRRVSNETSEDE